MDVDDQFAPPGLYRIRVCKCLVAPVQSEVKYGCVCPSCGGQCLECPGFGYAQPPEHRFHEILTRIRGQIRRRVRVRGCPPGYIRLAPVDVKVLVRKYRGEEASHWVREYVDLGPPLRIFDVIVVTDRRR